jgi:hypothetical protein
LSTVKLISLLHSLLKSEGDFPRSHEEPDAARSDFKVRWSPFTPCEWSSEPTRAENSSSYIPRRSNARAMLWFQTSTPSLKGDGPSNGCGFAPQQAPMSRRCGRPRAAYLISLQARARLRKPTDYSVAMGSAFLNSWGGDSTSKTVSVVESHVQRSDLHG